MLACTAFTTFSNSARVMMVLQSEGVALPPAGRSQSPCTVITGASGEIADFSLEVACSAAGASGRGFSTGAEGLAWPSAKPASSKQTAPLRNIVKSSSRDLWG